MNNIGQNIHFLNITQSVNAFDIKESKFLTDFKLIIRYEEIIPYREFLFLYFMESWHQTQYEYEKMKKKRHNEVILQLTNLTTSA